MAPRTKKTSSALVPTLTEKLMSKGFDVNGYDEGDVVEIDNKSYVVQLIGEQKVFELYVEEELKVEEYVPQPEAKPEPEPELEPVPEVEAEPEVQQVEPPVVEEKPKKERKPRAKKEKPDPVAVAEEAPVAEDDVVVEEKPKKTPKVKKEKKEKKVKEEVEGEKKRKKRDPSKPKRVREKTCFNVFVSEKMFELKDSMPSLTGRQRFSEACKLWKGLDEEEKTTLQEKFKVEQVKPVAVVP